MRKYFVGLFSVVLFSGIVYSAGLSLSKIGSISTDGKSYSEWWYAGTNPTLEGVAPAGASVVIKIDDTEVTVTTSDSGVWIYSSQNIPEGDHLVVISSGGDIISFTLHAGQVTPEGTVDDPATEVPVPETAGFPYPPLIMVSLAFVLFGYYLHLHNRLHSSRAFEQEVIRSLD